MAPIQRFANDDEDEDELQLGNGGAGVQPSSSQPQQQRALPTTSNDLIGDLLDIDFTSPQNPPAAKQVHSSAAIDLLGDGLVRILN